MATNNILFFCESLLLLLDFGVEGNHREMLV